jgi:hypothetical protein
MSLVKRIDYYFLEYGPENTDKVVEAVEERIKAKGVKTVIVASDSGKTAVKFCEKLKGLAKIIAISWKEMDSKNVESLKKYGAIIVQKSETPLSTKETADIRNAYYTLGQGFKVAVEVTLIAVDKGFINVGEEVISVGGTGGGADTAILVKASSTKDMLGSDIEKRLEIREIIAMPIEKKWWE